MEELKKSGFEPKKNFEGWKSSSEPVLSQKLWFDAQRK